MTNFDFLLSDPQFGSFADSAVAAERIYNICLLYTSLLPIRLVRGI